MPITAFKLGIDLDNTTGHYLDGLRLYLNATRGTPLDQMPDQVSRDIWTDWNRVFAHPGEFFDAHAEAVVDGSLLRHLRPFDGAVDALRDLIDKGVHVHLTTHRFCIPDRQGTGADSKIAFDTVAWWEDLGLPIYKDGRTVVHIHITADKDSTPVDLFADDRPTEVESRLELGKPAVLMDQTANRSAEHVHLPRVHNWAELGELTRRLSARKELGLPYGIAGMADELYNIEMESQGRRLQARITETFVRVQRHLGRDGTYEAARAAHVPPLPSRAESIANSLGADVVIDVSKEGPGLPPGLRTYVERQHQLGAEGLEL